MFFENESLINSVPKIESPRPYKPGIKQIFKLTTKKVNK